MLEEKEREISVLQQKVGQLTIECDWLKKNLTKSLDPTERIALVSKDEREISIVRQCELVDVSRGRVYREKDKANDDPRPWRKSGES